MRDVATIVVIIFAALRWRSNPPDQWFQMDRRPDWNLQAAWSMYPARSEPECLQRQGR